MRYTQPLRDRHAPHQRTPIEPDPQGPLLMVIVQVDV